MGPEVSVSRKCIESRSVRRRSVKDEKCQETNVRTKCEQECIEHKCQERSVMGPEQKCQETKCEGRSVNRKCIESRSVRRRSVKDEVSVRRRSVMDQKCEQEVKCIESRSARRRSVMGPEVKCIESRSAARRSVMGPESVNRKCIESRSCQRRSVKAKCDGTRSVNRKCIESRSAGRRSVKHEVSGSVKEIRVNRKFTESRSVQGKTESILKAEVWIGGSVIRRCDGRWVNKKCTKRRSVEKRKCEGKDVT
nr:axoneme-associated protein mst101(2)-like [Penaeus vannamei]